METAYQIVFFGETLPGRDGRLARRDLAAMFKLDPDRAGRVFSGKRVILKKGLTAERAMQYRLRFEAMGLRVRLEAVPVPVAVAGSAAPAGNPVRLPRRPPDAATEVRPVPATGLPGEGETRCPRCGEVQPRRTLCRACSVDMPRFAVAARAEGPRPVARDIALGAGAFPAGTARIEPAERRGRRGYLPGVLAVLLATVAGFFLVARLEGAASPAAAAVTAAKAFDPDRDRIVMYSLTTCGYCLEKRREFDRTGIQYSELFLDTDAAAMEGLNRKLAQAGHPGGGVGTPVVEVNGVLLPNNPSMAEIARHFRRAA
ncbi:MAG: hypothetical protein JNK22_18660 [Rhodocyclaceae bacterium]|nr:hypothetical protein [Rhodocyclaceae bacterium]